MTYLFNNPVEFADELIEGFVAANSSFVQQVSGGVVRSTISPAGEVAVVIGGGSGHYPAFAGIVGQGLAHGAAMGNVFASPSAHQVYTVAKAANNGGGVLLSYGNYAGDVLNFDAAQERLIAEGIPCRTVVVTDDISSASVAEITKRRGIAGDLTVFKAAAAAAASGADLDEVWRIATAANERTRSFGVAFGGCTLPGANAPLFTVPEGRMAVGMGIHGEPGIGEQDIPTADELAELLVSSLLAELPPTIETANGQRAAVILNGLGSVKYEELFVLYRRVARLLEAAGVTIVEPDVGELVTSFQMAGTSLTLFWLDDELEKTWRAPAYTPAYRKGSVLPGEARATVAGEEEQHAAIGEATVESREAATRLLAAIEALTAVVDANVDELGRLDSIAGDGDHGIGMQRGATAAAGAAREAAAGGAGARTLLAAAGDAWADRAGGTSGALWGLALNAIAARIDDSTVPQSRDITAGIADAVAAIMRYGKAELGDKTLLDTLIPFSESLTSGVDNGDRLAVAWARSAGVADAAAKSTAALLPKMGRARPHAEKSVGTPDPGAISMALIIRAIEPTLTTSGTTTEGENS
ncbi:MAG: dihydroxyacetone kinase family protein [Microbacteriaceae bacterium]|jgi:dihydroxyacetone kinase|nr:dihydroxyacetone kinase family protein [Microbacteriaceae bacterium]